MKKALSILLALISFGLVMPVALNLLITRPIGPKAFLFFHILSTLSITAAFLVSSRGNKDKKSGNVWWIFILVASLTLPFYGLVICIVIFLIQRYKKQSPPPILSDEITVQDPEVFKEVQKLSKQLQVLDRLDIEPFVDIFRRGQAELKKSAVKLLGTIKSKKAIETLSLALKDRDIEIRLFAAGVLSKIEDEYAKDIKTKETHFETSQHSRKSALELIHAYIAYADSGLIDKIASSYYLKEVLKILEQLPENEEALYTKAKMHYELDELDKALIEIEKTLSINSKETKYNELYWNILFEEHRFSDMAKSIQKADKEGVELADRDVVEYWT